MDVSKSCRPSSCRSSSFIYHSRLSPHPQPPKRRIPKQNAPPIEITKPKQTNNGHIEIIHPQTALTNQNKVVVDEVLINGRRYRVPERVVVLDFWSKVSKNANPGDRCVISPVFESLYLTCPMQRIGCRFWHVVTSDVPQLFGRSGRTNTSCSRTIIPRC